tara:strand:- start:38 stop:805 length:768 start_codon:yes stop_codon:yes gene_type:complete
MTRLILYNIEYCEGLTGHWYEYLKFWRTFSPPKGLDKLIIEKLKKEKPDILGLVEVDKGSFRSGKDEGVFISKSLGMNNIVEKVKYPLTGYLKLFHHVPILNKQSNSISSKYSLTDIKYHVLHEGTKRVIIEATAQLKKPVTLLLAHLALGGNTRKKQIKELIKIVNKIKNPVILMGDFNTFRGEVEIKDLLRKTCLQNKKSLHKDSQTLTEPSYHPKRRLDYVLTSSQIRVKDYKVLPYVLSDHLPLEVDFKVT